MDKFCLRVTIYFAHILPILVHFRYEIQTQRAISIKKKPHYHIFWTLSSFPNFWKTRYFGQNWSFFNFFCLHTFTLCWVQWNWLFSSKMHHTFFCRIPILRSPTIFLNLYLKICSPGPLFCFPLIAKRFAGDEVDSNESQIYFA